MEYPAKVSFEYPEKLSRGMLLLKTFFGFFYVWIPHGILLGLNGFCVFFAIFIAWWAILFTGRYPKGLFEFAAGYVRWTVRVYSYWGLFFNDKYPPFSGKE